MLTAAPRWPNICYLLVQGRPLLYLLILPPQFSHPRFRLLLLLLLLGPDFPHTLVVTLSLLPGEVRLSWQQFILLFCHLIVSLCHVYIRIPCHSFYDDIWFGSLTCDFRLL